MDALEVFPDSRHWSVRMRRATLRLPAADADLIKRGLQPLLKPYEDVVADYALRTSASPTPARAKVS